jgi:hypothetical protein
MLRTIASLVLTLALAAGALDLTAGVAQAQRGRRGGAAFIGPRGVYAYRGGYGYRRGSAYRPYYRYGYRSYYGYRWAPSYSVYYAPTPWYYPVYTPYYYPVPVYQPSVPVNPYSAYYAPVDASAPPPGYYNGE